MPTSRISISIRAGSHAFVYALCWRARTSRSRKARHSCWRPTRTRTISPHFHPAGGYLKSVRLNGQELTSPIIDVADGSNLDILLTYSPKVAEINGDVELSADQPAVVPHVFVVAPDGDWNSEKTISPDIDQFHHFICGKLRPGHYFAFAAEENDAALWDNPAFLDALRSDAVKLDLKENGHESIH